MKHFWNYWRTEMKNAVINVHGKGGTADETSQYISIVNMEKLVLDMLT